MTKSAQRPVFIGGTNGSGTRVLARMLEVGGVFQGREKNQAFEPTSIIQYTRPLVPELIKTTGGPVYDPDGLPSDFLALMEDWLLKFAAQVKSERPPGVLRWGWKHPRNIFLAPLLHRVFEGSFFIQVLRDGRDMVLAANRGDFVAHRECFNPPIRSDDIGAAMFWSRLNSEVSDWCADHFGARYVYSRFEDLCSDPIAELERIADVIELPLTAEMKNRCTEFITPPATIGRWKTLSVSRRNEVASVAARGLQKFGYLG